ncbi:hypothetical protein HanHA300_Chr09g0335011 [Helianthus annuus]|nr:hypothetical protein HanHA300_Chr09g0335011 [Helianthus annuus]KAJ0536266.1 hypothetical protein HanIR_Chr09g0439631 [Helianthus annuus]KAJ0708998.1 hypothetical protein HanLR1_Chr09g0335391 [Helianthus annuus]KAJ0712869.1 hypothetical protein HanOQP8_Chr09g0339501 [Helianthus annuus]
MNRNRHDKPSLYHVCSLKLHTSQPPPPLRFVVSGENITDVQHHVSIRRGSGRYRRHRSQLTNQSLLPFFLYSYRSLPPTGPRLIATIHFRLTSTISLVLKLFGHSLYTYRRSSFLQGCRI